MVNRSVHKVLHQYLDEVKPSEEDYLFRSRNGVNKPLTRETVNKMIKEWTKSLRGKLRDPYPEKDLWVHSEDQIWGLI